MDNRLKNELTISCYNTDCSFRMKPSAFMDFAQEMAYHAAGMFNFGYEDLQKQGTVWVLSRMHVHFHKMPMWQDIAWRQKREPQKRSVMTEARVSALVSPLPPQMLLRSRW